MRIKQVPPTHLTPRPHHLLRQLLCWDSALVSLADFSLTLISYLASPSLFTFKHSRHAAAQAQYIHQPRDKGRRCRRHSGGGGVASGGGEREERVRPVEKRVEVEHPAVSSNTTAVPQALRIHQTRGAD